MKKLILLIVISLLVACGSDTAVPPTVTLTPRDMQVILTNSEISLGPTRFGVALLGPDGALLHDGTVELQYFDLTDPQNPQPEQTAVATRRQTSDGFTTIYTDNRTFDRAGAWGVSVSAVFPDNTAAVQRVAFTVNETAAALAPGDTVPDVATATAASTAGDLSQISTAPEPNPAFYALSLDEAVQNGRWTLLYFSTPAFCQTRLCGPGYDEFNTLYASVGETYNFIHVEVFTNLPNPAAADWPLAPAMVAFNLMTEPWLYIINDAGEIVYRIEGLFTAAEMEELLPTLTGS